MDKIERAQISKAAQIEKYGGIEGYRAEMSRRRSMVKNLNSPFSDKEFARQASKKGLQHRWGKNEEESLS